MIDYSRLRAVTARQLDTALLADGFIFRRETGSHRRYAHPGGRRVTPTVHHWSDTFRPGTLRSMIEVQARWTEEDLQRLGLLP
jgi:predicted RNA binding protein YcfA (HicA-like mRNA interferase family)